MPLSKATRQLFSGHPYHKCTQDLLARRSKEAQVDWPTVLWHHNAIRHAGSTMLHPGHILSCSLHAECII